MLFIVDCFAEINNNKKNFVVLVLFCFFIFDGLFENYFELLTLKYF